jgi:hypothetical protein
MLARWIYMCILSFLLAACGGGGDSGSDAQSGAGTNSPPINNNPPSTGDEGDPAPTPTPPQPPSSEGDADGSGNSGGDSSGEDPSGDSFVYDETARFDRPTDLALDTAGNIYVMDDGNEAIRKIASNGEVSTIASSLRPGSLAADAQGNLYVLSYNAVEDEEFRTGMEVHRISPDGIRTLFYRSQIEPGSSDPRGVAVDAQGRVYLHTQYRNTFSVIRIDLDQDVHWVYRGTAFVIAMDSDEDGNLAVVASHPFGLEEYHIDFIPLAAQAAEPAEYDTPGVVRHSLDSKLGEEMVLEQNGDTYFAEAVESDDGVSAIRIRKRAQDGTVTTVYEGFPDGSTANRPKTENYQGQVGMVRAANGDFYLADPYVNAIYKVTPSGQVSLVAGKPGEQGNAD